MDACTEVKLHIFVISIKPVELRKLLQLPVQMPVKSRILLQMPLKRMPIFYHGRHSVEIKKI